jgi:hypothetical protein
VVLNLILAAEVQTELDSCGGCPGDLGQDCGELEGANGVQCSKNGKCVVCEFPTSSQNGRKAEADRSFIMIATCLSGYQLAIDGQSCVKATFTDMSSGKNGMVRRVRKSTGRNDTL